MIAFWFICPLRNNNTNYANNNKIKKSEQIKGRKWSLGSLPSHLFLPDKFHNNVAQSRAS